MSLLRLRLLGRSLLLLAGLLLAGLALRAVPALDPAALGGSLRHGGAPGILLFVLAGAALAGFGAPRQVVAFAGGYAYGAWAGTLLGLAAQGLGAALSLFWARAVARDWARRRLLRGRLGRLDAFLAANPFTATLVLRLLPVGNNLALNLLAGVSAVRAGPFLAASLLGYLPQTLVFALLGTGVRLGRGLQLGLGLALFLLSALCGLLLLRRHRRAREALAAVGP